MKLILYTSIIKPNHGIIVNDNYEKICDFSFLWNGKGTKKLLKHYEKYEISECLYFGNKDFAERMINHYFSQDAFKFTWMGANTYDISN